MDQNEEKNQKENKTENVKKIKKTQSNLQMFTRPFDLNKMHYDNGELHPDKEIEDTILLVLFFINFITNNNLSLIKCCRQNECV